MLREKKVTLQFDAHSRQTIYHHPVHLYCRRLFLRFSFFQRKKNFVTLLSSATSLLSQFSKHMKIQKSKMWTNIRQNIHTHSDSTHSRRQFIQYRKSTSAPCQVKVTGVDTSNRCLILFTRNDKKRQEIVFIRFLLWAIDIQHSTFNNKHIKPTKWKTTEKPSKTSFGERQTEHTHWTLNSMHSRVYW